MFVTNPSMPLFEYASNWYTTTNFQKVNLTFEKKMETTDELRKDKMAIARSYVTWKHRTTCANHDLKRCLAQPKNNCVISTPWDKR